MASRRKAEEYIKKGWIKINGEVATLGDKVDPDNDIVEIDEKVQKEKKEFKYIILNKPLGYVSNLPQKGEKEAKELLSPVDRKDVHVVGRLDKDSEGLLFFTNDGVVANRLKSPEFEVEKEYIVKTDKWISDEVISKYKTGIIIQGEKCKPVEVDQLGRNEYRFILKEGKNRQIRRMLNNFKINVVSLKRIRIGSLLLKDLEVGTYRSLSKGEIEKIDKKTDN